MPKQISEGRKKAYYTGSALQVIGLFVFLSTFATGGLGFFLMDLFPNPGIFMAVFSFQALVGFVLMLVGTIIRNIGEKGLAGAGVILDPEKARKDLEPYSRMTGGMVKDALDEADVTLGGKSEKIIMLKCPVCGTLNEENSKFCKECGKKL